MCIERPHDEPSVPLTIASMFGATFVNVDNVVRSCLSARSEVSIPRTSCAVTRKDSMWHIAKVAVVSGPLPVQVIGKIVDRPKLLEIRQSITMTIVLQSCEQEQQLIALLPPFLLEDPT